MTPMSEHQILEKMPHFGEWRYERSLLARDIRFPDFTAAWAFMNHVAACADSLDHHPNWYNVYNLVQIRLSTHDAGGVTEKDFELASLVDQYLSEREYTHLPRTHFQG
ncbi:MAG: 4a-hydroxytetrahydrobiopterin dehydratase [Gammaproteobacteria bacterium]|nr:4a-hydroxytetrahydrobiopterin dehydratase [Gammaproteobacteria bacterium]